MSLVIETTEGYLRIGDKASLNIHLQFFFIMMTPGILQKISRHYIAANALCINDVNTTKSLVCVEHKASPQRSFLSPAEASLMSGTSRYPSANVHHISIQL